MDLQLKDKVIIVTGGAKGIGKAAAQAFASEGAIAVVVGRKEADNLKVVEEIKASGGKAFQVAAELSNPETAKMR